MGKQSSRRRVKNKTRRSKAVVTRVANEQHLPPPPSDIIWRIVQLEQKISRVESAVAKLEGSSLGELSNLIEQMRTDCEQIQQNELAQMKAIQRARLAALAAAQQHVTDITGNIAKNFVGIDYFHSWVSRINEQLAQLAEPEPAHE